VDTVGVYRLTNVPENTDQWSDLVKEAVGGTPMITIYGSWCNVKITTFALENLN